MGINVMEIDEKKQRLILHGSCDELRPLCKATCCRNAWIIELSPEEYASQRYASQATCELTRKACEKDLTACLYRFYELKKGPDGACPHLDANNRCSIYLDRPKVCRDFFCQGGWRLSSVYPLQGGDPKMTVKQDAEAFIKDQPGDLTFVLHPLIRLFTVFVVKEKGEVSFLKELVGRCGKFYSRDMFPYPQFEDDLLLYLIQLFGNKDTLKEVYHHFCEDTGTSLTKSEFYEIVRLLHKHDIVINVKRFSGML
jgi:Fe-S-cluster containining protein